jgi:hypothetical protein
MVSVQKCHFEAITPKDHLSDIFCICMIAVSYLLAGHSGSKTT